MVGITLSSEQIRNAPREVRAWLEQEVLASFGWQRPAAKPSAAAPTACSVDEASRILASIRDMIPVVNVFFELGHAGAGETVEGLAAFRIADICRHARLRDPQQVEACLQIINDALCRVRDDAGAVFYSLDDRGYCFIAEQTQRSIATLWTELAASRDPGDAGWVSGKPAVTFMPFGQGHGSWNARAHPIDHSMAGTLSSHDGIAKMSQR
jgi:hypothetical protein